MNRSQSDSRNVAGFPNFEEYSEDLIGASYNEVLAGAWWNADRFVRHRERSW